MAQSQIKEEIRDLENTVALTLLNELKSKDIITSDT